MRSIRQLVQLATFLIGMSCLSTTAIGQTMHAIVVNLHKDFSIVDEDSVINIVEPGSDTQGFERVNADLRMAVKGLAEPLQINFAKCRLSGDTIIIDIRNSPGHYGILYTITLLQNKYAVSFVARTEKDRTDPPVMRELTRLVLNTLDLKKGKEIRGYTEFIGKCLTCDPAITMIDVRGNFKARIE